MKKIYVVIAILSVFILVSTATAYTPNSSEDYKIYGMFGKKHWFWNWQIDYKVNKIINNSKFRNIKDKIITKIGFNDFYNIIFDCMVKTFQYTGIIWNENFILGVRWISRSINNFIEVKSIIIGGQK